MNLYAAQPPRRGRQIAVDLFVVIWICLWAWQGWSTWSSIHSLTEPTRKTHSAASGIADNMDRAGDVLGAIPILGDTAAKPFHAAAKQADKLAEGATESEQTITTLAWRLGLAVGVTPTVLLLGFYAPPRIRFIREARATRAYMAVSGNPDSLAIRALTNQPLDVLVRVNADPAQAWRQGDPDTIRTLAALELHRCGQPVPGGIDLVPYLHGSTPLWGPPPAG